MRSWIRLVQVVVLAVVMVLGLAGLAWSAVEDPLADNGSGELQAEAVVSGTVIDSTTGELLADATVTINNQSATTGQDGSYTIADLQPGDYTMTASLSGYRSRTVYYLPVRGTTADPNMTMEIALTPNNANVGNIRGYVADIRNRATGLSGIMVQAADGLFTVTDGSGWYDINNVPLYDTYTVSALPHSSRGFLARSVTGVPANGGADFALAPSAGVESLGSITGQVVRDNGDGTTVPIANAWVRAGFGLLASTDIDGYFTFNNLIAGNYYLQAYLEGHLSTSVVADVATGAVVDLGSIALVSAPSAGWVEGWIQSSDGSRLNGVEVTIGGQTVVTGRRPGGDNYYNNGYYAFYGLTPGQYTVEAAFPGYRTRISNAIVVNPGAGAWYDLALVPDGAPVANITGTVKSATGGTGIGDAFVKIGWGMYVRSQANGSYILNDVPVGTPTVEVSATGYRTRNIYYVPIQPDASGTMTYNIALAANNTDVGNIKGYVTDIRNPSSGLSGVWVQAGDGLAVVTDGSGWYQINDVPQYQEYTVKALPRPGYGFLARSRAGIKPGQTADLALTPDFVGGLGSISGKVSKDDGTGIVGATVTAGFGLWTTTDVNGEYSFADLTPRIYNLQAFKSGYESATGSVEIIETNLEQTVDFNLATAANAGWIEGWVQRTDGTRLNGVTVTVGGQTVVTGRRPGNDSYYGNGYYAIYGLAPGQYSLEAALPGYRTRTTNAAGVAPGAGAWNDVALAPDGAPVTNLSGVVRSASGGTGIGGAIVKAGWGLVTQAAADGSYTLPDVPVGTANLEGHKDGYRSRVIYYVPMPEGDVVYDIALAGNNVSVSNIRGYVVDIRNRGQGLAGVWVQAANGLAVITDGNGWYQINDVPLYQSYTVKAMPKDGYGFLSRSYGPASSGDNVDLALTPDFVETGSLQGLVTSAVTGTPVANALVRTGFGLVTSTDANGIYSFDNLIPATYRLQVYKTGYEAATGSMEAIEHQPAYADFQLAPSATAGAVDGFVYYGASYPSYPFYGTHLNGALITVGAKQVATGRQPGSYPNNETKGYYSINGLAPGAYQATVVMPGYQLQVVSFDVAPNTTTRLDFNLAIGSSAPVVAITAPANDAQVSGKVTIAGTVTDDDLASYTLAFAPAGSEEWSDILTLANTPVVGGVLGQWNTTSLQPGNYQLRLSAVDTAQHEASVVVIVNIPSSDPLGVQSIDPSGAVEGTVVSVTIRGAGLAAGTVARIGGVALQNVTVDAQGTTLTGTLPPLLLAGLYNLEVVAPNRNPIEVVNAFRVVAESEVTSVAVDPAEAQVGPDGQSWVNIKVSQVLNLYGMELELAFDPRVVTVADLQSDVQFNLTGDGLPGDVFSLDGDRSLSLQDTDQDGTDDWAVLRLSATRSFDQHGYAGFNGDAVLVRVRLLGMAEGVSPLALENVELRGNAGEKGSEVELLLPLITSNGVFNVSTQAGIFGKIDLEGVASAVEDHTRDIEAGINTVIMINGTTDELQPDDTNNYSAQVTVNANGTFSLGSVPAGTYLVIASRQGFLTELVAADVRVETGTPLNLGSTILYTGDIGPVPDPNNAAIFGDDIVDLSDLIILRSSYGWQASEGAPRNFADLDWNGKVGLVDLVLLARNYSREGYPVLAGQ